MKKQNGYGIPKQKELTVLGLNFHVDLTENDDWMTDTNSSDFAASIVVEDMPSQLFPREIKKLVIEPRIPMELNAQGIFQYLPGEKTYGKKMQHAALSFFRFNEMGKEVGDAVVLEKETPDGIYFIVDLQSETAGYLDFDLEVSEACQMEVGWGEHLEDGRCRTDSHSGAFGRNFSVTVKLQKGRNSYMNPFRRLGCETVFMRYAKIRCDNVCMSIMKIAHGANRLFIRSILVTKCFAVIMHLTSMHFRERA